MKLKTFNQNNLPVAPKGKPVIRLSLPSGLITFSPKAGEILNLTQHSHVELCQNEDVPSDWYLHVTNAPPGFPIRRKDAKTGYNFNCTSVVRKFFGEIKFEGKACSYPISQTPEVVNGEKYFYILIKNPINEK